MPVGPRRSAVARAARWAGPALLVVEAALVLSGRLSLRTAVVLLIVLEASLALLVAWQLAGGVRRYRQQRAGGADREQAALDALAAVLPPPVAFLVRHELLAWSSIVLLIRRRKHGVTPGAVQVPYDAALRPLGLVLVGLSVVELVVFELVIPWQPVSIALPRTGSLDAAARSRPRRRQHRPPAPHHRRRAAPEVRDLRARAYPARRIAAAHPRRRYAPDSKALVHEDALVMSVSGTTDVDVDFNEPATITTSRGPVNVRTARFAADNPAAAVRALQDRVAARRR